MNENNDSSYRWIYGVDAPPWQYAFLSSDLQSKSRFILVEIPPGENGTPAGLFPGS